jgi:hypothetical protein
MKFPNLVWASSHDRLANYQVAAAAKMSESRFSRCLSGRAEFSEKERIRLANCLGYPEAWLFQQVEPPARVPRSTEDVSEDQGAALAGVTL